VLERWPLTEVSLATHGDFMQLCLAVRRHGRDGLQGVPAASVFG
jgi:hypothetical protein